jgi:hypothetical protein
MSMKRRDFVAGAALAASSRFIARSAEAAPSDRIRVAVIGMGGRGRQHMRLLAKIPESKWQHSATRMKRGCKKNVANLSA